MLTDKKNIDQLFESKLRDYEVTPPASLWNRIETELNTHERARKISRLKGFGIAAAVLSAFMAGWWLSDPADLNEPLENITAKVAPKTEVAGPEKLSALNSSGNPAGETRNQVSSGLNSTSGQKYKPSLASIASFASNTSFLNKKLEPSQADSGEPAFVDIEKEFLSHFQNNLNLIKRLSDWFATSNNKINRSDTILAGPAAIQSVRSFDKYKVPAYSTASKDEALKKTSPWTISAGIAPVSISQSPDGSSVPGLSTTAENSVSASMLAGYKIGKRVIVKSGIILSQLKQVTTNTNYPEMYSSSEMAFRTAHVTTPSGSVRFAGTAALKSNMLLSENILPLAGSEQSLKQEFSYVEIPAQVAYKLIDHKFNVALTGGFSTNILTGNNAGLYENGQKVNSGQTTNLRDITYSGAVGMVIGYDLGNRVTLTIEPRIKHFLNSLSSNNAIDYRPYQLDITTGVTYSFN